MKKTLIVLGLAVVVIVVAGVVGVTLFLDAGVKKAVEHVGPQLTKTAVRLDGVDLSLLSGRMELKGLFVGNPAGYKAASAITLGHAVLDLKPTSLFADKVIIETLDLRAPEITLEGGLKDNNLTRILANLDAAAGDAEPAGDATTKVQVDELVVREARVSAHVNVLGGQTLTLTLPDIRLTELGTGPDGITVASMSDKLLKLILARATEAVGQALAEAAGKAGEDAVNKAAGEAGKAVSDLFKKKKL